jgi:hypothetical protein
MDFLTKSEIESPFRRLDEILASDVFAPQNCGFLFVKSEPLNLSLNFFLVSFTYLISLFFKSKNLT